MNEWWQSLELFDKVIWIITIPVTVIFILEMILTFVGMDSGSDIETDFDLDAANDVTQAPFELFTFRNFINFLLGFGWTIISFRSTIDNQGILILLGVIVGCALVAAVMYIFVSLTKMAESGNMDIRNAIDKTGQVYLTIPAKKNGSGKVHINIQGTLRELDAITLGESIVSGQYVRVIDISKNNMLLVVPA
jgi:magnesium-transporting ATPase (P-type)